MTKVYILTAVAVTLALCWTLDVRIAWWIPAIFSASYIYGGISSIRAIPNAMKPDFLERLDNKACEQAGFYLFQHPNQYIKQRKHFLLWSKVFVPLKFSMAICLILYAMYCFV